MFFHSRKYVIRNMIPNTYFSLWILTHVFTIFFKYSFHIILNNTTTQKIHERFKMLLRKIALPSPRRPWIGDGLKVILAVHFAITTLEHLIITLLIRSRHMLFHSLAHQPFKVRIYEYKWYCEMLDISI